MPLQFKLCFTDAFRATTTSLQEAIASELGGLFHYERGHRQKAWELMVNSLECYEKWGATAVANRVRVFTETKFGSDFGNLASIDSVLTSFFASDQQGLTTKRKVSGGDEVG